MGRRGQVLVPAVVVPVMIPALVLAATVEQCDTGTTYDMRTCWSKRADAAYGELEAAQQRVVAEMQKLGIDPKPFADATAAWKSARDQTCEFEYRQYLPGTIAPQLQAECDFRMTNARALRLDALPESLRTHGGVATAAPASTGVDAELIRVYGLYRSRLEIELRVLLEASERAWLLYREKECAIEGGSCVADLAKERLAELEASWVGEPFW